MTGKEQISLLRELQTLETELAALNKRQKENSDAKMRIQDEVAADETKLSQDSDVLVKLRKTYREMESENRTATDQVRKLNAKLNMVKTNKEYHALLKEIDQIKRDISAAEDRILAFLDELEAKDAAIQAQETQLTQTQAQAIETFGKIDQEGLELQTRCAALAETRQGLMEKLPAAVHRMYIQVVRSQSNGLAVVPVVNAVCGGCNVNIPPQMFNEMQRCDTIKLCPSCQRMIYWPACCE